MYYTSIVLIAVAILLIENHDILFDGDVSQDIPVRERYKQFLYGVLVYYTVDALWGIFDSLRLASLLFVDTTIYFAALAAGIMLWTRFVVTYLGEDTAFSRFLSHAGQIFFAAVLAAMILNFFTPILFRIDENAAYHASDARYAFLAVQIILFLLTSLYTQRTMEQVQGPKRKRYRTVCLFGLTMAIFLSFQWSYPLLPLYTLGYMLGTCLLRTFVILDAKDEYKQNLSDALQREKTQHAELKSAWQLAYTDSLTGLKNKLAYMEMEEQKDALIASRTIAPFAIAVFDLNGLKAINDCFGHKTGDQYIIRASRLICDHFKHSPVYRIGGDEFVALLEGPDFENRNALHHSFDKVMDDANRQGNTMIISMGLSEYDEDDHTFHHVFSRADQEMYLRKRQLKRDAEKRSEQQAKTA
ncbi:MAG: GGDEF domain-containing protein [Schwartzia sp.]|nr:GGDEF domain-containing protein [Schwartzia sp. (in: firmicutes)]